MSRIERSSALFFVLALVLAAAGCTASNRSTSAAPQTSSPAATGAPTGSTKPAGATITATLTEWAVAPSATTAAPGTITFTATNNGTKTHELLLVKTDLPPDELPLDAEGAVDERGAGLEFVDEVEGVTPGSTKSFTVEGVAAGTYLLLCNLVDDGETHVGHQMYVPFTVA